jgi:hypothetical protein
MWYISIIDILGVVAVLFTLGIGVFLLIIKVINRCRKKNIDKKTE